jgi:hypothetical protein
MDRLPEVSKSKTGLIVIVGVCGSGKTLLADGLKRLGYDARSVSQEHSLVPDLFMRSSPRVVIYLDASDDMVSHRKQTHWEPRQLDDQRRRLKLARKMADIRISTDGLKPHRLLEIAVRELGSGF